MAAGDASMRSHYKMASYNVHAGPKGVYFKLGQLPGSGVLLGGSSNAGLVDPAQNAAISLGKISMLICGGEWTFDDLVCGKVINRLVGEIPRDFAKADARLQRDHRLREEATTKPSADD